MNQEFNLSRSPERGGSQLRAILLSGIAAFVGGGLLVGYLVQNGQLQLGPEPAPATSTQASAGQAGANPTPSPAIGVGELDQQIALLEQRMARLNLQAAAFDGNSARAEGLLVALAARRAVEQGKPLGYLEGQLKTRFGDARPEAVKTVIDGGRTPITLDELAAQLDDLAPALLGQPRGETGWQRFKREMGGLFVIRRESGRVQRPAVRVDQARLLLRSGQIDDAIKQVGLMPGADAAKNWINAARHYQQLQDALAALEDAALTEPERMRGGTGEPIRQPGLSANQAALVTP